MLRTTTVLNVRSGAARDGLCATAKSFEKLRGVHSIFERFASVDEDDGDFFVVFLAEFGVGIDIDFAPDEVVVGLKLRELIFDYFAEGASVAGVDENFVHWAIVDGKLGTSALVLRCALSKTESKFVWARFVQ